LISGILLLSSCIVIGKIFYEGLKAYFLKKRCIIDIDNYIPYLSNFKTIDFDYPLLVGGQIFYFIIFALYSFNLPLVFRFFTSGAPAGRMLFIYVISEGDFLTIILYFLMILSIVLFLYILIGTFIALYKNYHMKDSMIEFLPSKLNLNDQIGRIYYLQLYNLIKTKKLWEVGLIAKITTIISVASTLFPLIQNIVIS